MPLFANSPKRLTAIRLGQARNKAPVAELTQRELAGIKLAQQKIRKFAQVERNSMMDFKVIRQLYDRVEIDSFGGPSETMVIVGHTADAEIVATELRGLAEHGNRSPYGEGAPYCVAAT